MLKCKKKGKCKFNNIYRLFNFKTTEEEENPSIISEFLVVKKSNLISCVDLCLPSASWDNTGAEVGKYIWPSQTFRSRMYIWGNIFGQVRLLDLGCTYGEIRLGQVRLLDLGCTYGEIILGQVKLLDLGCTHGEIILGQVRLLDLGCTRGRTTHKASQLEPFESWTKNIN